MFLLRTIIDCVVVNVALSLILKPNPFVANIDWKNQHQKFAI